MCFQVIQPSSGHTGQSLLSPSKAELREPDKGALLLAKFYPAVHLLLFWAVAVRKELRMKNTDTGNTRAGYLPLWQLSARLGGHRITVGLLGEGAWKGGIEWCGSYWVDLQLYLPGLGFSASGRLWTVSLYGQYDKFPLDGPYNWNWELGLWIKTERQLEKNERKVTFATYCVTFAFKDQL